MPAKAKTILNTKLTSEDRRAYAFAAKSLLRLHLTAALASKGIAIQNFNMWCHGHDRLGEEKQMAMLGLFGLTPHGQLMDTYTHAWRITGRESVPEVEQLLAREVGLLSVVIQFAYAIATPSGSELALVGALVQWTGPFTAGSGVKERTRRVILTQAPGTWLEEDFKEWVIKLFKGLAKSNKELSVGTDLRLSISAANNIWRWNSQIRTSSGARVTTPKRKALLPFNQDLIGETSSAESAVAVLQDMTPRFKELAQKQSLARDVDIGPHDRALIRRAEQALDNVPSQN